MERESAGNVQTSSGRDSSLGQDYLSKQLLQSINECSGLNQRGHGSAGRIEMAVVGQGARYCLWLVSVPSVFRVYAVDLLMKYQ